MPLGRFISGLAARLRRQPDTGAGLESIEAALEAPGARGATREAAPEDAAFERAKQVASLMSAMVEHSPISALQLDADLIVRYVNRAAANSLVSLEIIAAGGADSNLLGKPVETLHRDLAGERQRLQDPLNLPWRTRVQFGPELYNLLFNPLHDEQGKYLGLLLTLDRVTAKVRAFEKLQFASRQLTDMGKQLTAASRSMAGGGPMILHLRRVRRRKPARRSRTIFI